MKSGSWIEGFVDETGVAGVGAVTRGAPGLPDMAAFLVVDRDGVPSVIGPFQIDSVKASENMADVYARAKGSLPLSIADGYDDRLSEGLAFFGLSHAYGDTLTAWCARADVAASKGKLSQANAEVSAAKKLADASSAAVSMLDAPVMRAMRGTSSFSRSDFSYYASVGAQGDNAEEIAANRDRLRKLRLQAAEAYPALASAMARKLTIKIAIDHSKPLNEAVISAFGAHPDGRPVFAKAVLRRLQGMDWSTPPGVTPEWLSEIIGSLPPDWFPKTPEEWVAFVTVSKGLGHTLPQTLGVGFVDLVAGCGGKWVEFRKRLAKSYFDTRPPEVLDEAGRVAWLRNPPQPDDSLDALQNAVIGLEDMVESFSRLVVLPAAALVSGEDKPYLGEVQRASARHAAAKLLFGGKTAAAMLEFSRHYHTQAERVLGETTGHAIPKPSVYKEVAEDGWAPLCNQVQAPNGVWILPLTDARELDDEGRTGKNNDGSHGLEHCVGRGSYESGCRDKGHHILSLRTLDDNGLPKRLATMQIGPISEGERKIKRLQFSAHRNTEAPPEAKEAWQWFETAVASELVPLNYEGIRKYLITQSTQRRDDVERSCGYEWKEEGAIDRALAAWSEWLGKAVRNAGTKGFLESPEVVQAAHAISPPRLMAAMG